MKWLKDFLWGFFGEEYVKSKIEWDNISTGLKNDLERERRDSAELKKQLNNIEFAFLDLQELLEEKEEYIKKHGPLSEIDSFCEQKGFEEIKNIAYQNKRSFETSKINVFINEFITFDSWEVENFRRTIAFSDSPIVLAQKVGGRVASFLTWTSDSNLVSSPDFYMYPSEVLVRERGDCEDHAFLVASISKKFGVAYGSYVNFKGDIEWHAFNVFLNNGKLYLLDTVSNTAIIDPYEEQTRYVIDYIITKTKTYKVEGRVHFGRLAGWDNE